MRPADRAWLALGVGVIAYDLLSKPDELMSEGADRYLERRPWLTRAVVTVTALHLINLLPCYVDPFYLAGTARQRVALGKLRAPVRSGERIKLDNWE